MVRNIFIQKKTRYSYLLEKNFIKKITKRELLINELNHINNLIEEEDRNFNKVKISILYGSIFILWICISNIEELINIFNIEITKSFFLIIIVVVIFLAILSISIFIIYTTTQWKMRIELMSLKKELIKKLEKNKNKS